MTPELSGEHLHRYAVAEPSCVGKRVLDLWCGTGRGSAFLARRATSVVGIDADEKTIVRARRNHYQENLQFARAAPDNLPLVGNTIDVITCFDTLERIAEPDALFEEFCRVLAPGGLLFISSPNRLVRSDERGDAEPPGARDLYFEEFRDLLQRYFTKFRIYGQRQVRSSVVHPLGGSRDASAGWSTGDARGAEDGLAALDDPDHFVAVCSFGPLPDGISGGFIDPVRDAPFAPPAAPSPEPSAQAAPARADRVRILLSCAPKSGSTYATSVLARYFDAKIASKTLLDMQWEAEQNLTRGFLEQFVDDAYVLQLHMKPYELFLALMREYGVKLLLQWRNLGDTIVSLDEHLAEFGVDQPVCYIHDGPGFLAMPAEARYAYLIANAVGWYLWYYLAWRKEGEPFGVYERMVADPKAFFANAIERLGHPVDAKRLKSVLAKPEGFVRINVGRVGRSAELFSDHNKRALEAAILNNPWSAELEILLWELPWDVPALAAGGKFDGSVVRTATGEDLYFVSRGVRRRLSRPESWLASRSTLSPDTVRVITPRQMKALALGTDII